MHFRSALIGLIIATCAAPAALAQATPEAALARFLSLANAGELTTPEGQAILTGEAKELATASKSNLPAADKVVAVSPTFAAARIVLRSPAGEEADAYFYLEKTAAGWAVSAYRQMVMTGMDMMLLAEMRKQRELSPDDQIAKENLELTLSSDSQLRGWFAANRAAIEEMARVHAGAAFPPSPGVTRDGIVAASLKSLSLGSIETQGDITQVLIGATFDNSVGFLRAGPSGPPAISPSLYIWIEELGDGWFLFRTT